MKKISEKKGITAKLIFADYDLDSYSYDLNVEVSDENMFPE